MRPSSLVTFGHDHPELVRSIMQPIFRSHVPSEHVHHSTRVCLVPCCTPGSLMQDQASLVCLELAREQSLETYLCCLLNIWMISEYTKPPQRSVFGWHLPSRPSVWVLGCCKVTMAILERLKTFQGTCKSQRGCRGADTQGCCVSLLIEILWQVQMTQK